MRSRISAPISRSAADGGIAGGVLMKASTAARFTGGR